MTRYPMFGLPCGHCGHAAYFIEVYPNGVRTVHIDRWKRPCDVVQPDPQPRTGVVPSVLPHAPASVRSPSLQRKGA